MWAILRFIYLATIFPVSAEKGWTESRAELRAFHDRPIGIVGFLPWWMAVCVRFLRPFRSVFRLSALEAYQSCIVQWHQTKSSETPYTRWWRGCNTIPNVTSSWFQSVSHRFSPGNFPNNKNHQNDMLANSHHHHHHHSPSYLFLLAPSARADAQIAATHTEQENIFLRRIFHFIKFVCAERVPFNFRLLYELCAAIITSFLLSLTINLYTFLNHRR